MNQDVLKAKQDVVNEIVTKAKASQSIVVAEYRGLTVSQIQELRRALAKEKASMNVYKNSLVARAMKELGYAGVDDLLTGPNAIFFSEEISNGPKVLVKYAKRFGDTFKIKGGIADGFTLNAKQVVEISKLPNREGLLSMLLSCLQAPVRQFACTVKAVADAK